MKKRRKHTNCLNCGQTLHEKHNFCANCGQENTDNEAGVGLLLREFTSNFLSLDSRFGRTLKPFLFSPGKITNAFNSGKRVFYANPIRWYLVISIFHFFFFIRNVSSDSSDSKGRGFITNSDDSELTVAEFDSLYNLPDSLHQIDNWPISGHYFTMIDELNKDKELKPQGIMDSLKLNDLPWVRKQATKKFIKINRESTASLNQYIMRQIPAIMFFILPLHAFLLKLFFWRKGLYIKHLIHSLHLHSFFFFVLALAWITVLVFGEPVRNISPGIAMLTGMIYILISFRKVYKVRWIWTVFRYFMVGFLYSIILSFMLIAGVLVSLALF
ncbi:MAG: DUF3667 domain-containing protein [Cyclobacteriaceae bacterium]